MLRAESPFLSKINPRSKAQVNAKLEKQLSAYILAASSTAVAALAAALPASAEVVYTPTHVVVSTGSSYAIDINHDGTPDFTLNLCGSGYRKSFVLLQPDVAGNAVRIPVNGPAGSAAALPVGVLIGREQNFNDIPGSVCLEKAAGQIMAGVYFYHTSYQYGPWLGATNRYLGLKFMIDDEVHFGWARLTVDSFSFLNGSKVTLTGYAYETEANHVIRAGEESGLAEEKDGSAPTDVSSPDVPTPEQRTLGHLALGAARYAAEEIL